ncbi:MAG: hypothetical protein AB7L94_06290 [Kofleriaceae bacterium]
MTRTLGVAGERGAVVGAIASCDGIVIGPTTEGPVTLDDGTVSVGALAMLAGCGVATVADGSPYGSIGCIGPDGPVWMVGEPLVFGSIGIAGPEGPIASARGAGVRVSAAVAVEMGLDAREAPFARRGAISERPARKPAAPPAASQRAVSRLSDIEPPFGLGGRERRKNESGPRVARAIRGPPGNGREN